MLPYFFTAFPSSSLSRIATAALAALALSTVLSACGDLDELVGRHGDDSDQNGVDDSEFRGDGTIPSDGNPSDTDDGPPDDTLPNEGEGDANEDDNGNDGEGDASEGEGDSDPPRDNHPAPPTECEEQGVSAEGHCDIDDLGDSVWVHCEDGRVQSEFCGIADMLNSDKCDDTIGAPQCRRAWQPVFFAETPVYACYNNTTEEFTHILAFQAGDALEQMPDGTTQYLGTYEFTNYSEVHVSIPGHLDMSYVADPNKFLANRIGTIAGNASDEDCIGIGFESTEGLNETLSCLEYYAGDLGSVDGTLQFLPYGQAIYETQEDWGTPGYPEIMTFTFYAVYVIEAGVVTVGWYDQGMVMSRYLHFTMNGTALESQETLDSYGTPYCTQ
jgi:hypothetical protein